MPKTCILTPKMHFFTKLSARTLNMYALTSFGLRFRRSKISWNDKKKKKKKKKKIFAYVKTTSKPRVGGILPSCRYSVAYPGGCIACACTPGGSKRGAKKEGRKRKKQGKGEKKRERKGAPKKERREEKGKKICKRKGKEGRNQKKIGCKKKNTRMATREWQ